VVERSSTATKNEHAPAWPRLTSMLLIGVGVVLAAITFAVVVRMPDLVWHSARDAELRATYEAYRETGVPLVKVNGTGSNAIPVVGTEEYGPAAWDDDTGVYLVASLMSHVTGSDSPYPGLKAVMALLCAAPLVVLPLAVARLFRSARAGYALLLLPVVTWLTNSHTLLIGTEYGLADAAAPTPVYALYGVAAALAFASLTVLLLLSTARLGLRGLVAVTLAVGLLAGVGNLMRTMSGLGIAIAVGVLWWLHLRRHRWAWASAGAAVAVVLALAVPSVAMRVVDAERAHLTGIPAAEIPTGHTLWHSAYLGLSYPTPMTGEPSPFDVVWSDAYGWEQAQRVRPDVVVASTEYDDVMKGIYIDEIRGMPVAAARLYAQKTVFTLAHFAAMLAVAALGVGFAVRRAGTHRRRVGGAVALTVPVLLVGLVPPVLVMPMLYYFSEISAAVGLLTAVGVGALAWVVTSAPSWARAAERPKVTARLASLAPAVVPGSVGVVLATPARATAVGDSVVGRLPTPADGGPDEIVVVPHGSTPVDDDVPAQPASRDPRLVLLPGDKMLGGALRAGVLASSADRLLLITDAGPGVSEELAAFRALPGDPVVASSVPPAGTDAGRGGWGRCFRALRGALLYTRSEVPASLWVDGTWARSFAALSREEGPLWTTELVMAAERQGAPVVAVPMPGAGLGTTPTTFRGTVRALPALFRLALQKDDYRRDAWHPVPAREPVVAPR
jgi:hypothetical protein